MIRGTTGDIGDGVVLGIMADTGTLITQDGMADSVRTGDITTITDTDPDMETISAKTAGTVQGMTPRMMKGCSPEKKGQPYEEA